MFQPNLRAQRKHSAAWEGNQTKWRKDLLLAEYWKRTEEPSQGKFREMGCQGEGTQQANQGANLKLRKIEKERNRGAEVDPWQQNQNL